MNKKKLPQAAKQPEVKPPSRPFTIPYPLVWLAAAVLLVYGGSLQFGFTELDDSIFIRELSAYNEDLSNLITSFQRGVFDSAKDTYYRPLFLNAMLLNYQISGQDVAGYHAVNILLHLISVFFLFRLLGRLGMERVPAFLLSLIFAVHPVLSQAVAWIPGRNDTLMAAFILPYLMLSIDYSNKRNPVHLILAAVCLLAALFTKETAILAPAAAFILLVVALGKKWLAKPQLVQNGIWVLSVAVYLFARTAASLKD